VAALLSVDNRFGAAMGREILDQSGTIKVWRTITTQLNDPAATTPALPHRSPADQFSQNRPGAEAASPISRSEVLVAPSLGGDSENFG
jgi:hypothetical protein